MSFFVHDNIYLFSHYSKLQNRNIDNTRHPISHGKDCTAVSRERKEFSDINTFCVKYLAKMINGNGLFYL